MSQSAADAVRFFRENGYAVLRGFFTPAETDRLASGALSYHNAKTDLMHVGVTHHGRSFERSYDVWQQSEIARSVAFDPNLARICSDMLGCDALRIISDDVFVKRPGDRVSNWHYDRAFVPIDNDRFLSVWIPLADVTHDMGALAYAAGSHKRRYVSPRKPFTGQIRGHLWYETQMRLRKERVERIEATRGDVLIHHGNTLHMAGANSSDRARIAYGIHYVDARSRFVVPGNDNQRVHVRDAKWDSLRPGDEIETTSSPVVYSREGQHRATA
ncbi:MAG: phytanoyl-CoA dioxygenase family protein [Vulcanimicrobiaceae bacterium]